MDQRTRAAADRRRKFTIAIVAAVVGVAIVVPIAGSLLVQMFSSDAASEQSNQTPTSTAPPVYTIKPLSVRPVIAVEGVLPETCPPPGPSDPAVEVRVCDFTRTALYTLGPQGVALQLVRVDSLLSPITNGYIVQVAMNSESASAFADYTRTQVGKQIAFVRASTVVSAPQISEAVVGDLLQLSGNLTEQQSDEMARLLQDET
ncbi:SecDF P1 head subdomain-containing protein [Mycolicibacterium tokaiense]|uniref:Protein export protein SecD, putative n=1 Tax=Mycolicibacterium tokaiense TaxID=39695 RepID=A0A378T7Z0_9MYCO|nr:hypothetical protein [Mycolicibacterium tokaiense]BBY88725.1 hypothetical protein MTOK_45070 [Mycolicibacterium tokaiense]STZ56750.1 protein export protein SecD, putative [Mycolicibacterium tokaiense]